MHSDNPEKEAQDYIHDLDKRNKEPLIVRCFHCDDMIEEGSGTRIEGEPKEVCKTCYQNYLKWKKEKQSE